MPIQKTRKRVPPHKRIAIKISGELLGNGDFGIDPNVINYVGDQIKSLRVHMKTEIVVVVGGGNFWRGKTTSVQGMDKDTADYLGMLCTILNGRSLKDVLKAKGIESRVMTALETKQVAEPYIRDRALRHLEKGRVVICVAGTGNPGFTTDTGVMVRAGELEANLVVMIKNMPNGKPGGVYNADPRKNPKARKFKRLTYRQAIVEQLEVMDITALTKASENKIQTVVCDIANPGNLRRAVEGRAVGTLVTN